MLMVCAYAFVCISVCVFSLIDTASRREERPVETAQLRLLVHKSAVGAIIGKGGEVNKHTPDHTMGGRHIECG